MNAIRPCATKRCTNPGPLFIVVPEEEGFYREGDAKADARCLPCLTAINVRLDGLEGDELHEQRFCVLQMDVTSLRTQQYPVQARGQWVYECCVEVAANCKHLQPGQTADDLAVLLRDHLFGPR